MPRRTSSVTRSGCFSAYASASVEPHEPPKTCHFSIPRCSRTLSVSETRSHVVFASRLAYGVDFPQPRWSKTTMRYLSGWKKRRTLGSDPPPGPPWRNTAGLPFGFPLSSQ